MFRIKVLKNTTINFEINCGIQCDVDKKKPRTNPEILFREGAELLKVMKTIS